jgi:hypothetical protein
MSSDIIRHQKGIIMAMDMPPPAVEYRMERHQAGEAGQLFGALRQMRTGVARAAPENAAGRPLPSGALPRIDPASRSLTPDDRKALASAIEANGRREMSSGVRAPASYVGDRIRLAAERTRAMEQSTQGTLTPDRAKAVKCHTVAVAMDARAGAYVVGGEAAAREARGAVPHEVVEECRRTMARRAEEARIARTGVTPTSRAQQVGQPVRTAPSVGERHAVELAAASPVRIDPQASPKVRVDPTPMHRQQISFGGGQGR